MALIIATPVRGADPMTALVTAGYSEFRAQLAQYMPDFKLLAGAVVFCMDVVRARNRIAAHVLTNPEFAEVTHVLWVDDDTYPERVQIVPEMIQFAETKKAGIVSVPYTNKRKPIHWTHRADGEKVLGVGMGFTLTTREALRAVWDRTQSTYYDGDLLCRNMFGQLMGSIGIKSVLLSEDYSFCVRALAAGVKIELYTEGGLIRHSGAYAWDARDMVCDHFTEALNATRQEIAAGVRQGLTDEEIADEIRAARARS